MFTRRLDTSLSILEAIVGIDHNGPLEIRVNRLNNKFSKAAAGNPIRAIGKRYLDVLIAAPAADTLGERVADIVVREIVRAIVNKTNVGHRHHWVPRAFLSRFGENNGKSRTSRIRIHEAVWRDSGWKTRSLLDTEFCHGYKGLYAAERSSDRLDFYSKLIEFMLGGIEGGFVDEYRANTGAVENLLTLAVMQIVRVPRNGEFISGKTQDILPRIAEVLDSLDAVTARVVPGDDFVFTAGFPTRSRRLADGSLVHYFPMSSDAALVFSTDTDVALLPEWIGEVFDDAAIESAKRHGTPVFGSRTAIAEL